MMDLLMNMGGGGGLSPDMLASILGGGGATLTPEQIQKLLEKLKQNN